ncbi:cation transporter [Paenibacillus alkaliterrae]|uniref:heavy-metal-associated domain-containing protein n=1 Tax=Paenibacillus alkaliterrae TaxID=320909 RepID=UPI001F35F711|nr:heavy metal-associated domain-containing protein [Paenibacillus alkaliterrae]MCF2940602.1 cation transporter [Paenibacillus alkaliterrae]
MKIVKMALFSVLMLSFAFMISACGSQEKSINAAAITISPENIEKASFTVTGMYCASCPFVVKTAIEHVDGVKTVNLKTKGETGTAEVEFDKSNTDLKTIKQSVHDLGYGIQ